MPRLPGRRYVEALMGTRHLFLRALLSGTGQCHWMELPGRAHLHSRFWLAHFAAPLMRSWCVGLANSQQTDRLVDIDNGQATRDPRPVD